LFLHGFYLRCPTIGPRWERYTPQLDIRGFWSTVGDWRNFVYLIKIFERGILAEIKRRRRVN
jgi:hypothetical protein